MPLSEPVIPSVTLRPPQQSDIAAFLDHASDRGARWQAAFCLAEAPDPVAFEHRWQSMLVDPPVLVRTVLVDAEVAGHVATWIAEDGSPEITYWLGRQFWGAGVGARGLRLFLSEESRRPLRARCAADNHASVKILVAAGFRQVGSEPDYAPARGEIVDELIFELA